MLLPWLINNFPSLSPQLKYYILSYFSSLQWYHLWNILQDTSNVSYLDEDPDHLVTPNETSGRWRWKAETKWIIRYIRSAGVSKFVARSLAPFPATKGTRSTPGWERESVVAGCRRCRGKSNIQGRIPFDLARSHGVKDRCNLPDIVLLTKISNDVAPGTSDTNSLPASLNGQRILSGWGWSLLDFLWISSFLYFPLLFGSPSFYFTMWALSFKLYLASLTRCPVYFAPGGIIESFAFIDLFASFKVRWSAAFYRGSLNFELTALLNYRAIRSFDASPTVTFRVISMTVGG